LQAGSQAAEQGDFDMSPAGHGLHDGVVTVGSVHGDLADTPNEHRHGGFRAQAFELVLRRNETAGKRLQGAVHEGGLDRGKRGHAGCRVDEQCGRGTLNDPTCVNVVCVGGDYCVYVVWVRCFVKSSTRESACSVSYLSWPHRSQW
jgi:hypothetical protein